MRSSLKSINDFFGSLHVIFTSQLRLPALRYSEDFLLANHSLRFRCKDGEIDRRDLRHHQLFDSMDTPWKRLERKRCGIVLHVATPADVGGEVVIFEARGLRFTLFPGQWPHSIREPRTCLGGNEWTHCHKSTRRKIVEKSLFCCIYLNQDPSRFYRRCCGLLV